MWFEESVGDNEKRSYHVLEVLCETRSKYHEIKILKLANLMQIRNGFRWN